MFFQDFYFISVENKFLSKNFQSNKGKKLTQIEWSIIKKQKLKIKNIISITVLILIQLRNLDLSEYFLIEHPNLKNFQLFKLQYTKKKLIKLYFLVNYFFTGQK